MLERKLGLRACVLTKLTFILLFIVQQHYSLLFSLPIENPQRTKGLHNYEKFDLVDWPKTQTS